MRHLKWLAGEIGDELVDALLVQMFGDGTLDDLPDGVRSGRRGPTRP